MPGPSQRTTRQSLNHSQGFCHMHNYSVLEETFLRPKSLLRSALQVTRYPQQACIHHKECLTRMPTEQQPSLKSSRISEAITHLFIQLGQPPCHKRHCLNVAQHPLQLLLIDLHQAHTVASTAGLSVLHGHNLPSAISLSKAMISSKAPMDHAGRLHQVLGKSATWKRLTQACHLS